MIKIEGTWTRQTVDKGTPYRRTKTGCLLALVASATSAKPAPETDWVENAWPDLGEAGTGYGPSPNEEAFDSQKSPGTLNLFIEQLKESQEGKPLEWTLEANVTPHITTTLTLCSRFQIEVRVVEAKQQRIDLFARREGYRKALGTYSTLDEAKRMAQASLAFEDVLFGGEDLGVTRKGWKAWHGRYV